jgi:hypothetical protein
MYTFIPWGKPAAAHTKKKICCCAQKRQSTNKILHDSAEFFFHIADSWEITNQLQKINQDSQVTIFSCLQLNNVNHQHELHGS